MSSSARNGPPGARRSMKNVSVPIAHSVGTIASSRRSRERVTSAGGGRAARGSAVDPQIREWMHVERRGVEAAHVRLDQLVGGHVIDRRDRTLVEQDRLGL